ncbi:MAG: extracellular solute-binding protein, partial [Oscillospiraceae bacterium]|nr:extracellular solute-binding protein [Oscillospiraceae bacterium]
MKLKRIIAGLTSMVMLGSLAGCGGSTVAPEVTPEVTTAAAAGDATTAAGGDAAAETTAAEENAVPTLQELYGDETIQITVFSQLANYSGKLTGWFAEVMKREFNCEMTIIPDTDGMFDTRMESGDLGDIVIFGSNGDQYQRAVAEGMLYDLNEDDLLANYGSYMMENMPYALENNANLNETVTGEKVMHGIGHNVATSPDDHEAFFYTMDVRWDLYKELGYPEINNLDEFYQLMVDMKGLCPTDENGNETYATSLWPDWDGNMVMYVKAFATCYWGYDEMGFGLYDVENGDFHYALEEGGPYLESLKFFNKLYQAGLIDPNSMTQTYNEMSEKVTAGGTFFSIFDYAGSQLYNTDVHLEEGKAMYPMVPNDATPLCYGMNVLGGNRMYTIGANTEYPELCMAIINYLTTPEGYMTYNYGPKDLCWYYDEEGNSCLTELGEQAQADRKGTMMPDEWGGGTFNDGTFQGNNTTWSKDASNPDSNGETYNYINWKSRRTDENYDILQDWRDKYGQYTFQDYMNTTNFKVALGTSYTESKRSDDLKIIWEQVAECLINYTWQAIYAESDEEYDRIVNEMIT